MKYALLINSQPGSYEAFSDAERQAITAEYMAIGAEPECVGGAQLHGADTATTVRVQDGQTLTTDGPFADTKEVFGGYFLFDVDGLDEAIAVAARIPAARLGGSVEVRPVMER
ncbi:MAG TPA: YciI family protein [Solirubrobacteraceae bacterium]|nr:YciI family protein [Solirubrobacteraceae bacterium]